MSTAFIIHRLRRSLSFTAAVALVAQATGLAAQPVVDAVPPSQPDAPRPVEELSPTSAWNADFAADNCSLTRTFGDQVTLRLRQFAPDWAIEVTLASSTLELDADKPSFAFAAAAPREVSFFQTFRVDDGLRGVIFDAWLPTDPADGTAPAYLPLTQDPAMQTADRLTVGSVFDRDLTLRTGRLEQPLKILETCLDDLLTGWGLDAAAHHALSKPVTERDEDEPWPGPLTGAGIVGQWPSDKMDFILLVDATGLVGECRLVGGLPEDGGLAEQICDAMPKTWRFDPALDANGQPIKSFHRATMIKARLPSSTVVF